MDEYKKIASTLVSFKSVSGDDRYAADCEKTAKYLMELLSSFGCETKLLQGYGNPVVYGSYVVDPSLQTCLIYGHYDVQDASLEDGWETDPFTIAERDGRLYGRGIMDDKCQFLILILAIKDLIHEKKLGYNIKFLFEGSEEIGSPFMEKCIQDNKDMLSCDFVFLSDGEMTGGKPTLELGNRGLINMTVVLRTSTSDIHSGIYGGASPNAVHELSKLLSSFIDKNNTITIESFYDDVENIDEILDIPFDLEEYKKNSGTKAVLTEPGFDFYTQTGLRPSITVTGIYGGYLHEGHRTAIPASATAKINIRIVKNQDPKKIFALIEKHIAKFLPEYVDFTVSFDQSAKANKTDKNNKSVKHAKQILEEVFKTQVVYRYVGGSEPVVLYFQEILQKPVVSVPFANEDSFMHGINENFLIENIKQAFVFCRRFFSITS